jgi:MEMO1 family protein
MDYPKLRQLDIFFAKKDLICIRDSEGFSDTILLLPPAAFFICSLFDGEHSIMDIQNEFTREFGEILFTDQVKEIESKLDSAFFLENETFFAHKKTIVAEFKSSDIRLPFFAGRSYPEDPHSLRAMLDSLIGDAAIKKRPGPIPDRAKLKALIAPHIDIGRGAACYASAYAELAASKPPDTIVILGISHMMSEEPYILSNKKFETPFGSLDPDAEFIKRLVSKCSIDFYKDEILHRCEHSIEFLSVFLTHLYGEAHRVKIVPILCGTSPRVALSGKSPCADVQVREFIDALSATIAESEREICIIAGVDLSHMGKRFGSDISITPNRLADLESDDRRMIRHILDCDAEGFMRNIIADEDARNVCGVPAIYTLLKIVNSDTADLLGYNQSVEEETSSVVTFASIAFR